MRKFSIFTLVVFMFLFITTVAQPPALAWAKGFGGPQGEFAYGVTVDLDGNVYTTGYFIGKADFDPGAGVFELTSGGNSDVFISKIDAAGNFVWAKRMGGADFDIAQAIDVDILGNVLITGSFRGTADFDPNAGTASLSSASSGEYNIFIAKYNSAGDYQWAKQIMGLISNYAFGIAVDATGSSYISGDFQGTADFDPGAGTANLTSNVRANYILKLNSLGNYGWAKQFSGSSTLQSFAIAVDNAANVYTTGFFGSTVDFDPNAGVANLVPKGARDIFVSKLDSAGNYLWAQNFGGVLNDYGYGITTDAAHVYITGYFSSSVDFDPGPGVSIPSNEGNSDVFVLKLTAAGGFVWVKSMGGALGDGANAIAVDNAGNVYTTGYYAVVSDFDPGAASATITSAGSLDIFISKLDASGNYVWATGFGTASSEQGYGVAVDAAGNLHTTGIFNGTIDFDPSVAVSNLTSRGSSDGFVIKYLASALLPVTLTGFNASYVNTGQVKLSWQSARELSAKSFILERSNSNLRFEAIATIVASGNSSNTKSYSYLDLNPAKGTNFYRLKMVDFDGSFTYSKVAAININVKLALHLYPNPAASTLYVQAGGLKQKAIITIVNALGRQVLQQPVTIDGLTAINVDVTGLPAGKYYVSINLKEGRQVKEFVKANN